MVTLSDDPAAADAGFEPATVRDACDPSAFAGCTENLGSFLRAVSRILEALAGEANGVLVKEGGRYRLIDHEKPGSVVPEPDLFDLGAATD
jgi:hypothetical protein